MKLSEAGERKVIEIIRNAVRRSPGMIADFDEDAAIADLREGMYAITADMGLMETHFLTDNPAKIGRKIVTSNVTDLLAKGAMPAYALVSLGLPADYDTSFVKRLYTSMDNELSKYGGFIIGGDTNKSQTFIYAVTMIGKVTRPVLRSGAKTGDFVVLTGRVGSAAAGYMALKRKLKAEPAFISAQLEPKIDLALCRKIIPNANAGIDISDGLAYELGEIARLSSKRIVIKWDEIPVHPKLYEFCKNNKLDMKEIVLHHGEDYQIVYTTPDPTNGIIIGEVSEGRGVHLLKDGKEEKLEPRGYEHFRSN